MVCYGGLYEKAIFAFLLIDLIVLLAVVVGGVFVFKAYTGDAKASTVSKTVPTTDYKKVGTYPIRSIASLSDLTGSSADNDTSAAEVTSVLGYNSTSGTYTFFLSKDEADTSKNPYQKSLNFPVSTNSGDDVEVTVPPIKDTSVAENFTPTVTVYESGGDVGAEQSVLGSKFEYNTPFSLNPFAETGNIRFKFVFSVLTPTIFHITGDNFLVHQ